MTTKHPLEGVIVEMAEQSLNERVALALGWTMIQSKFGRLTGYPSGEIGNGFRLAPNFEHSLDACLTWLWPLLQERGAKGFTWFAPSVADEGIGMLVFRNIRGTHDRGTGPTPSSAFCEAFLSAVEVTE